jgi:hypothetical protein
MFNFTRKRKKNTTKINDKNDMPLYYLSLVSGKTYED